VSARKAVETFAPTAERYARQEMGRYVPDIVLGLAEPVEADRLLDLGAGPGTLTRLLEPYVGLAVGLDVTPQMLDEYRLRTRGVAVVADGECLPFADASFTLVVCGSVFHHLADPAAATKEVARVLQPGGRFLLIDMVAPEEPARRAARDRVEAARDPSHIATLSPSMVHAALTWAGLRPRAEERQMEDKRDDEWVELTGGDLERVREAIRADEGEAAGFLALRWEPAGHYVFRRERGYYLAVKRG